MLQKVLAKIVLWCVGPRAARTEPGTSTSKKSKGEGAARAREGAARARNEKTLGSAGVERQSEKKVEPAESEKKVEHCVTHCKMASCFLLRKLNQPMKGALHVQHIFHYVIHPDYFDTYIIIENFPLPPNTTYLNNDGDFYELCRNIVYWKLLPRQTEDVMYFVDKFFDRATALTKPRIEALCVTSYKLFKACPSHMGFFLYGFDHETAKAFISFCANDDSCKFRTAANSPEESPVVRFLCNPDGSLPITPYIDDETFQTYKIPSNTNEVAVYVRPVITSDGTIATEKAEAYKAIMEFVGEKMKKTMNTAERRHGLHVYVLPQIDREHDLALIVHGFTSAQGLELVEHLKSDFGHYSGFRCNLKIGDKIETIPTVIPVLQAHNGKAVNLAGRCAERNSRSPTPSMASSDFSRDFPLMDSQYSTPNGRNTPPILYDRHTPPLATPLANAWFTKNAKNERQHDSHFFAMAPKPADQLSENYVVTYESNTHPEYGKIEAYENGSLKSVNYDTTHRDQGKMEFYDNGELIACTYEKPHRNASPHTCKEYYANGSLQSTEFWDKDKIITKKLPNGMTYNFVPDSQKK